MKKYLKIWLKTTNLSLQSHLATKGASLMYIIGKIIRFFFFVFLLVVVMGEKESLAGYDLGQIIIFFLIFNFLDMIAQILYRGIYHFRPQIISGQFDLTLVKPANPLFLILTADTDLLDIPLLLIVLIMLLKQNIKIVFPNLLMFLIVLISAFVIITAIHIFTASVGIITTEVDHIIWVYRNLSLMGRVPVDIYIDSVRFLLTFITPIALIFTFPAKALLGFLNWSLVLYSLLFSIVFIFCSLKLWHYALKQYSSASS